MKNPTIHDFDLIEECISYAVIKSHRLCNSQAYWDAWHRIKDGARSAIAQKRSVSDEPGVNESEREGAVLHGND